MLPQLSSKFPSRAAGLLIACVLVATGCGERGTPEEQVRATIAEAERAAGARDLAGILEHVSPVFRDERGGGREDLKQYLRGYLLTHPSVHVFTRIEEIEFPYRDYARVRLTVGTLGSETSSSPLDLAADLQEVALELQLEDGRWKAVRAAWRTTRRG